MESAGADQVFESNDDPVEALARAFQPLAADLQDGGIGVGEWIEAIKIASYRAARDATDSRSGRAIFTRISVRTGMTRSELQRLRRKLYGHGDVGRMPRLAGKPRTWRVLEGWFSNPDFCDAEGRPMPLPMDGPGPSLHSLIRQYAGDVPPSSVIAVLRDQGLLVQVDRLRIAPRRTNPRLPLRRLRQLEQLTRTKAREPPRSERRSHGRPRLPDRPGLT